MKSILYSGYFILLYKENMNKNFTPFTASNLICHPECIVFVITMKKHQSSKKGLLKILKAKKRAVKPQYLIDSKHFKSNHSLSRFGWCEIFNILITSCTLKSSNSILGQYVIFLVNIKFWIRPKHYKIKSTYDFHGIYSMFLTSFIPLYSALHMFWLEMSNNM